MELQYLIVCLLGAYGGGVVITNLFFEKNLQPNSRRAIAIYIGISIPIFLILNALYQVHWSPEIDFKGGFQSLPDYLMLCVTIITAVFLYKTLIAQQETLSAQQEALKEEQRSNQLLEFENRFFKFIDYHRDNVNSMKYRDPKSLQENYIEGNRVFTSIFYNIRYLLKCYDDNLSSKSKEEKIEAIDFIYQCVFYGASVESKNI